MLNQVTTKNKLSVPLLVAAAAFFTLVAPDSAFAAGFSCMDGQMGLFKTIACKITTSLYDIRKIVYIIGGLGLVAFTFAAIFNKISFKHLANIALSLFLLSMMTPFIEYFTQEEGHTLTFHDKLPEDFSDEDWTTDGKCTPGSCPKMTGELSMEQRYQVDQALGLENRKLKDGVALDPKMKGIGGLAKEPVDNRSGWQKLKDGIKKGVGIVRDAKNAVDAGIATVTTVATVGRGVYDSVKNTDFSNPNDIFNTIKGAAGGVTTATGAIISGAGTVGDIYFDKEGEKTVGQKTEDFFQGTHDKANDVKDMTGDVGEGYNMGADVGNYGDRISKPFK